MPRYRGGILNTILAAAIVARALIDAAFARVLGVPSLRPFAEMLGREPVLTDTPLIVEPEAGPGEGAQEQLSLF